MYLINSTQLYLFTQINASVDAGVPCHQGHPMRAPHQQGQTPLATRSVVRLLEEMDYEPPEPVLSSLQDAAATAGVVGHFPGDGRLQVQANGLQGIHDLLKLGAGVGVRGPTAGQEGFDLAGDVLWGQAAWGRISEHHIFTDH